MPVETIKKICFVGAGQMGCFNSLLAATAGYKVTVYDPSEKALATLNERQRQISAYLVQQKLLSGEAVEAGWQRVCTAADPAQAAADADLLSESVPEQLDLKRDVLQQFDALCPPQTILTTNTSSLLISEVESAVSRGDRIAALHSHLGSLLFDIVGGPRTAPATLDVLTQYVRSLHGTPIVHAKERRGYIANALFGALDSAALMLLINGTGTTEDIDRAWMSFQQARSGPFGIMDFVGLDVVRDVASGQLNKPLFHHDAQKIVDFLEPFLNSGRLGVKTGQGFYSYPNPEYLKPDFLTAKPADRNLYVPLLRRLLAAAIMLVVLGDASAETVDLTWTITTRSPLGPFGTLKSQWLEIMLNELSVHAAQTDPGGVAERVADFLQKHL